VLRQRAGTKGAFSGCDRYGAFNGIFTILDRIGAGMELRYSVSLGDALQIELF